MTKSLTKHLVKEPEYLHRQDTVKFVIRRGRWNVLSTSDSDLVNESIAHLFEKERENPPSSISLEGALVLIGN